MFNVLSWLQVYPSSFFHALLLLQSKMLRSWQQSRPAGFQTRKAGERGVSSTAAYLRWSSVSGLPYT